MPRTKKFWAIVLTVLAVAFQPMLAQEADPQPAAQPAAEEKPAAEAEPLVSVQEGLAMRYQRFENTMLQVAEYLRKSDPERAELLVRAIGKSKETRLPDQFANLVNLLKQEQLGDALDEQEHVVVLMQGLLELLQSEDRKDEIEKEKARIRDLIKDVDRLIDKQTDVRSDTERKENPDRLKDRQEKIAGDAQKLVDKIDGQDAAKAAAKAAKQSAGKSGKPAQANPKDGDSKEGDTKEGDPKEGDKPEDGDAKDGDQKDPDSKDGEPKDGDPKDGKPNDGEPKGKDGEKPKDGDKPKIGNPPKDGEKPMDDAESSPSDGEPKDGEKGKPSKSKPSKSKPGESGKPGETPESDPSDEDQQSEEESQEDEAPSQRTKTPGREEIERAKEDMERAIEELKKKNHGKASDEQDRAIAELMKAKEKLEEILRQLREEEREMLLAALEARFQDMLKRELVVYNGTVALHAVPETQRSDRHRNRSVELARGQDEIALLAAKALTLLKEEGSSIAFPEAVEQMRDDMLIVVARLERFDVADLTQGIEKDIIESLEELIEALQQEMEKAKDKKQNPDQQNQQQDPPLVDQLAELKTLRALQHRVNRRTKVLGREVDGEQAVDQDVIQQLREQARRQDKIQRATYDLSTGKNK